MAIVDLGTQNMVTGLNPVAFTPFAYDQTQAYGIGCLFTSGNFNLIFSDIRIFAVITMPSFPTFYDARPIIIEINAIPQLFFWAASPLFFGSGDVTFIAERRPRWRGAGDGTPVTLQLLYDDAITVPSWRA